MDQEHLPESLMERLASLEHARWAKWQRYVHENGQRNRDGTIVIPQELVQRWERQIETPYEALTQEERESDREQVRQYLPLIDEYVQDELSDERTSANSDGRTQDEYDFERASLDSAHYHNEVARDTFIGLGHTAVFASSIAFASDAVPLQQASWVWLLASAWTCNVIGLSSIALSFGAARRAIDARRVALNDKTAPSVKVAEHSNNVAVWSFLLSLLAVFGFLIVNVAEIGMGKGKDTGPDHSDYGTFGATPSPRPPSFNPGQNPGTGVLPSPRPPQPNPTPTPTKR